MPEPTVPDLRTAAQALYEAVAGDAERLGRCDVCGRVAAGHKSDCPAEAVRAALAAEATEPPPPPEPCDACEIESSGNCRAHRSRPVWQQSGPAPDPQGADEPGMRAVKDASGRVAGFEWDGAPDEPTDDDGGQRDG